MKLLALIFTLKKVPILTWSSFDTLNLKPKSITLIYLIIGLILFGLGETLLITANAGVSPWTVLAQGISVKTGYSIGITTFIVSVSVLCLWIPLKQKPGIGTILNTIVISVVIDVSLPYLPSPEFTCVTNNTDHHWRSHCWLRKRFLLDCQSWSWTERWIDDWITKNDKLIYSFNTRDH